GQTAPRSSCLVTRRPGRSARNANTSKAFGRRSEEHTSELQSLTNLVCRLLLEKKNRQGPIRRYGLRTHAPRRRKRQAATRRRSAPLRRTAESALCRPRTHLPTPSLPPPFSCLSMPRPPIPSLFPYTTLFRSPARPRREAPAW